jgi:TatD DNase family protein
VVEAADVSDDGEIVLTTSVGAANTFCHVADRILIETDAPYLAPVPKRGKPNEPSYVSYTADFLAEHLGLSRTELGQGTRENFFRLFSRAEPPKQAAS